jgi:3'(2'), 5'-bisphosphate nucleotidase
MSFALELQTALHAARTAAHICQSIHESLLEGVEKSGREPVTIADFASQLVINAILRAAFPDDAYWGEEKADDFFHVLGPTAQTQVLDYAGAVLGQTVTPEQARLWLTSPSDGRRRWVIDPIDGTKGFLARRAYAIAIALVVAGEVKLGVLACPNLNFADISAQGEGEIFYAVRGGGAIRTGLEPGALLQTLGVSQTGAGQTVRIVTSVESSHSDKDFFGRVLGGLNASQIETFALDGQGKYGLVAGGRVEAYFRRVPDPTYREKTWDHAAGLIIVEEAGGQVSDFAGRPLDFSHGARFENNEGIVVSNGHLHQDLLRAIHKAQS